MFLFAALSRDFERVRGREALSTLSAVSSLCSQPQEQVKFDPSPILCFAAFSRDVSVLLGAITHPPHALLSQQQYAPRYHCKLGTSSTSPSPSFVALSKDASELGEAITQTLVV